MAQLKKHIEHLSVLSGLENKLDCLKGKESTANYAEVIKALSAAEQRFWCLIRMNCMIADLPLPCLNRLSKENEKILEKSLKKKEIDDKTFEASIKQFSNGVVDFLEDEAQPAEKKQALLEALQLQEAEMKQANRQKKKELVIQGLVCSALSAAAIALVAFQATLGVPIFVPLALIACSYIILAKDIHVPQALSHAMKWIQDTCEEKRITSLAGVFLLGASLLKDIQKPSNPILEQVFKIAKDLLPTIPKATVGLGVAALVPPLHFCTQFLKYRKNDRLISKISDPQPIKDRLPALAPAC